MLGFLMWSRNQLTRKKSDLVAHMFYILIFEKEELQTYF